MSHGPYPVLVHNHGWMKAHLNDTHYQVCYLSRGDLHLDVQMYRMTYDEAAKILKKTSLSLSTKPDLKVPVTLVQEKYDPKLYHLLRKE